MELKMWAIEASIHVRRLAEWSLASLWPSPTSSGSIVVIPIAAYGIRYISRMQLATSLSGWCCKLRPCLYRAARRITAAD